MERKGKERIWRGQPTLRMGYVFLSHWLKAFADATGYSEEPDSKLLLLKKQFMSPNGEIHLVHN